jgi:hypothetical protein
MHFFAIELFLPVQGAAGTKLYAHKDVQAWIFFRHSLVTLLAV